jgi:hypothetical protein
MDGKDGNVNRCSHCGQPGGAEVSAWSSKKVPIGFGTGSNVDYAMKEFGLSFRVTVASDDPRAMRREGERLWIEIEEAIDAQIRRGAGDHGRLGIQQPQPARQAVATPEPRQANGGGQRHQPSGERVAGGATVQQIKFIMDLAMKQRVSQDQMRKKLIDLFEKETLEQLTGKEASRVLAEVFNIKSRQRAAQ